MTAHPDLIAQGEQTRKDIIELAPGIWTAVGYAASTVHMIEGATTVTIIDTTETTQAAENILAEFRKLTDKPVVRIILTHTPTCLLYTSPSPRDGLLSRMPSSA